MHLCIYMFICITIMDKRITFRKPRPHNPKPRPNPDSPPPLSNSNSSSSQRMISHNESHPMELKYKWFCCIPIHIRFQRHSTD
ncbi:unnamed protein product [Cunninghamella blakesleeana]